MFRFWLDNASHNSFVNWNETEERQYFDGKKKKKCA